MTYLEFRKTLLPFEVFSTRDIIKSFPDFDSRRLTEWQKKGYLRKITNKWYLFTEIPLDDQLLYRISNCICQPSYISLESALAYYHLIPEAVYMQKAITTKKTITYSSSIGTFEFRNVKPKLFFGYTIRHKDRLPILIAEMEKAILDYFFHTPSLQTIRDIEALRLNRTELNMNLNWEKLGNYQLIFANKALDRRIKNLQSYLKNADTF